MKGLELLKEIRTAPSFMGGNDRYRLCLDSDLLFTKDCDVIEKELKALEIIKNKRVDVYALLDLVKTAKKDYKWAFEYYNSYQIKLTQEEFDLLIEVLV